MKKTKMIFALVLAVLASMALMSCGKNNPKALAKETIELTKQLAAGTGDRTRIENRIKEIEAALEKMSGPNKLIYSAEFMRLSSENAGALVESFVKNEEVQAAFREMEAAVNSPEFQEGVRAFNENLEAAKSPEAQAQLQEGISSFNQQMNEMLNSKETQDALKALESMGLSTTKE